MSKHRPKPVRPAKPQPATATSSTVAATAATPSWVWLTAILTLTALVFANTLDAGFVNWDDHGYLWLNPLVQPVSVMNPGQIFTSHTSGNYSPLVVLTYCVEHSFDTIVKPGEMVADNFNPFTYHLTNVALHLGATAAAFFLFRSMGLKAWGLAFAVALFGFHPMRSESVAWVTERKDVLYGLFYIGALYAYWQYIRRQAGRTAWMIATLILGLLSYFSKIQAVALPLSMLAMDYYAGRDVKNVKIWLEKLPFFAVSLAIGLVGLHFLQLAEGLKDTGYPFHERLIFAAWSLWTYLYKAIWPMSLSAYYPYPPTGQLPIYYLAAPALLAAGAWWVWRNRRDRDIVFGLLFFLVNIFFVLQIKGAGKAFMADRFTYIPYLGLFFIVGKKLMEWTEKGRRPMPLYAAAIFVAMCAILTWRQNATWHSSITLWENVTAKFPNDDLSWNNKGLAHLDLDEYDKALFCYEKALKADPSDFDSQFNMGATLFNLKRFAEALPYYDKVLAQRPESADGHFARGQVYAALKDPVKAVADFDEAVKSGVKKTKHEIEMVKGMAWYDANQPLQALPAYDAAIAEQATADAYFRRGNTWAASGNMPKALEDYERSLALQPDHPDTWNNKGNALAASGRFSEALPAYEQVLRLKPNAADAYCNRGLARHSMGDLTGACADWNAALERGYVPAQGLLQQYCR